MNPKLLFAIALIACGFVRAQDVPPPPKPKDSGPSLEATMKFIEERISAVGPLDYISYVHDNKVGNDWTNTWHYQITNFTANASSCRIDYHFHEHREGQVNDQDLWLALKFVREVKVLSREQLFKEADSKDGHPEKSARVDPAVFVLKTEFTNNNYQFFEFSDESIANRVAQAMVHAVELCGGGSKDPF